MDSNTIWAGTDDGLIQVTRDNGKTLEERHAAGNRAVGEGFDHGRVALRRERRVRRGEHVPSRRPAPAHFPHARRRQDLDGDRDRHRAAARTINTVQRRHQAQRDCSSPAARRRSGSRSTTAITGIRCASTCRRQSIRDLIIKDDDIAVGTHGRGFWILDDITALRQWNEAAANDAVTLFKPETATRVSYSMYTDTPVPPDEPYGGESARRRDHRLLPEARCERAGHARDSHAGRTRGAEILEHRSRRSR